MDSTVRSENARPAIYVTSGIDAWAHTAKRLYEVAGYVPSMWLAPQQFDRAAVTEAFPTVTFPSYEEMCRSGWGGIATTTGCGSLDQHSARELAPYWDSLMSMAARSPWATLQYSQIRLRILSTYAFFRSYMCTNAVSCVVFSESPHKVAPYLIYAAAKSLNVPTVVFVGTGIGRIFATTEVGGTPLGLDEAMAALTPDQTQSVLASATVASNKLASLRTRSPEDNMPHYVVSRMASERAVGRIPVRLRHLTDWRRYRHNLRRAKQQLRYRFTKKSRQLSELKRTYEQLAIRQPRPPYVLVALHYQPERTTNPDGGCYDEQALMVRLLASYVPDGWRVCVKEHPAQFFNTLAGHLGRTTDFYDAVTQFDNVDLLTSDVWGMEVVSNAKAVATVTGTIGFEAIVKDVPVLAFGRPWYTGCPGVHVVQSASDVEESIASIARGVRGRPTEVDRYIAALIQTSKSGFLNSSDAVTSVLPEEELPETLCGEILRVLEHTTHS